MRISEMNTKEAAVCLCKLAAPMGRIGEDKALNAYLKGMTNNKGKTLLEVISGALATLLPVLLENHYADTITVISALTGKSVQEIEDQNILLTMRDAQSVVDKDLLDFFTALRGTDGAK